MTYFVQKNIIKTEQQSEMSKPSVEPALHHITNEIVNRMLKLQQLFHQKYLTADLLNELVATYVQAIECFDHTYSPMRKYFLSKIQFVVSQPEIDNMLKRNAQSNSMVDAIRETVRATVEKTSSEQHITQEMLIQAIEAENKKYRKLQEKNSKNSIEKLKQSTQTNSKTQNSTEKTQRPSKQAKVSEQVKAIHHEKKIELEMNLMREVSENIKNFENQDKKLHKETKRINALMVEQNNTLQARLAMRKKGKNRKKSIDEKFVQEVQQIMPVIQKQELKTAQKQIQQAVQRMTARLTMRQGTNKGATGLIIGRNTNQEEKYRGRIKIKNEVNQIDEDEEDLLATDAFSKKDNPEKRLDATKIQFRGSDNGTARFTLGQNSGKGRIKMRDTTKMDEDEEQLM